MLSAVTPARVSELADKPAKVSGLATSPDNTSPVGLNRNPDPNKLPAPNKLGAPVGDKPDTDKPAGTSGETVNVSGIYAASATTNSVIWSLADQVQGAAWVTNVPPS